MSQVPVEFNDEQKVAFEQLSEPLQQLVLHTQHAFIRVKATKADDMALTDSKFGGVPFIPNDQSYPVSAKDTPLSLLAQINFEQLHETFAEGDNAIQIPKLDLLPKTGLLQIFIDVSDELYGFDLESDNPYPNNDSYQVRYVTDLSVEPLSNIDAFVAQSVKDADEINSPISKPCKLSFDIDYGCVNCSFDVLEYMTALEELDYEDDDYDDEMYELMDNIANNTGHKLFGIPYFTQSDPRFEGAEEILLLQIDTDNDNEICWGDGGVANFFITPKQLKSLAFDQLMYNWDCA